MLALGRVREQGRGLALGGRGGVGGGGGGGVGGGGGAGGWGGGGVGQLGRGQEQGLVLGRVREQVLHKQPPDS